MNTIVIYSSRALVFAIGVTHICAQPLITTQPQSQAVNQGFDASFRVVASGTGLSYRWFFNSETVPLGTTNLLTLTNAQPQVAGNYFVVVSDSAGSATSRVARLAVVAPVALDPKLSANVPIGTDPLNTTNRNQGEIHVARSFGDPQLLMAVFQDELAPELALVSSYAVSKDSGLHWQRAFIPDVSKLTGGAEHYAADNVAAIDLNGNLFQISASFSAADVYTISSARWIISKSADAGQSFSAPVTLATNDALTYPDKGWLAVNSSRKSRRFGRLAFSYTANAQSGLTGQTYIRYSDDQGATWSPRLGVGPNRTTGSQTFFLPDGTLAVLYRSYLPGTGTIPNFGPGDIEIAISQDGGQSFGRPSIVQDLTGKIYSVWPKEWDSVHFPSACSDAQSGVIYVAYQALGLNQRKSIMFTRTIDKGHSWSAPIPVNDTPNNFDVFSPAVAVSPDGQHVTVEFYDQRNQTTNSAGYNFDLYLAESFDGGATWEPNIRLSEFSSDLRNAAKRSSGGLGAFLGDYQAIAPSINFDTPAVAVWIDTRAGNNDPYAVQIRRTRGTTFEAWQRLRFSTNELANASISGPNGDPDRDGIANLAEYAFGLEPNQPDSSPLVVRVDDSGQSPMLTIGFERLAVLGDIQVSWESSRDLVQWAHAQPAAVNVMAGHEPWMEHVQTSFSQTDQATFYRLRVSKTMTSP